MNRRSFLSTFGLLGVIEKVPRLTYRLQPTPQRALLETSEDRLMGMLALIPDTGTFRSFLVSDMRWVDVTRQADAWGSSVEDALGQGYWPSFGESSRSLAKYGIDQALSVEQIADDGSAHTLGVWTGIDPHSLVEHLRLLEFEELDFGGVTLFLQREVDLRRMFLDARHRFIAVLEDHNAMTIASSEELILEYGGSLAGGVPKLSEGELDSVRPLIREVAWTQQWLPGAILDKSNAEFPVIGTPLPTETKETIRRLDQIENRQFGMAPRVIHFSIGEDAGFTAKNLRDQEEPPRTVAIGYEEPSQLIKLRYESKTEALRACEIIEWRWENALSWLSGEPLLDTMLPHDIDLSEIGSGIITQTFASRSSYLPWRMVHSPDLSIYGWG